MLQKLLSGLVAFLDLFPGTKTYVVGVGLIGYGMYMLANGDVSHALLAFGTGFTAVFGRRAVDRPLPPAPPINGQ